MKARITPLMLLLLLAPSPATAQHTKRAAKGEDTGPVSVTRSAALRVTISSDAVGIFNYLSDSRKLILVSGPSHHRTTTGRKVPLPVDRHARRVEWRGNGVHQG